MNIEFKDVESYYNWMSQGNCFAPKFHDLASSAKSFWIEDFKKYKGGKNN